MRSLLSVALLLVSTAGVLNGQVVGWDTPRTVKIDDIELSYRDIGAGEPLVILHGFLGSGAGWKPEAEYLASTFRVIVPDLRMHGFTTGGSLPFTYRRAAQDILALLDSLGIAEYRALGHSGGGMTLLHMATAQPERVQRMVLSGTMPYHTVEARRNYKPVDSYSEEELTRLGAQHRGGIAQARALAATLYGFKDDASDMIFTPPLLELIRAPTLIVHGDRDANMPVYVPTELYRSIPNAALWIVPNAPHWPFGNDLKAPEYQQFLYTALKFLKGSGS